MTNPEYHPRNRVRGYFEEPTTSTPEFSAMVNPYEQITDLHTQVHNLRCQLSQLERSKKSAGTIWATVASVSAVAAAILGILSYGFYREKEEAGRNLEDAHMQIEVLSDEIRDMAYRINVLQRRSAPPYSTSQGNRNSAYGE